MKESTQIVKWMWMTEYCRKMLWNPHNSYFWDKAEEVYYKEFPSNV